MKDIGSVWGHDKLSLFNKIKLQIEFSKHNWICGQHSGFPTCCILFFMLRSQFLEPYISILPKVITRCKKNKEFTEKFGKKFGLDFF